MEQLWGAEGCRVRQVSRESDRNFGIPKCTYFRGEARTGFDVHVKATKYVGESPITIMEELFVDGVHLR
jgi:hypothetical protein